MKLADWIDRSDLRRIDVADRIGRDPAVVTRLCEGDALTATNVRAIHDVTDGAVCPNDLFGLFPAAGDAGRGAMQAEGRCHAVKVLALDDAAATGGIADGESLIARVHTALVRDGFAAPAVVQGGAGAGAGAASAGGHADGRDLPVLLVLVHGGSVPPDRVPDNANTDDQVDAHRQDRPGRGATGETRQGMAGRRWIDRLFGTGKATGREDAA